MANRKKNRHWSNRSLPIVGMDAYEYLHKRFVEKTRSKMAGLAHDEFFVESIRLQAFIDILNFMKNRLTPKNGEYLTYAQKEDI